LEQFEGRIINGLRVFTSPEVEKILAVETERLRAWVKEFIEPTIKSSTSGRKHYFSKIDIYKIAVFKKLVDSGVNRFIAKRIIEQFSDQEWFQIKSGSFAKYMFVEINVKNRKSWKDSLKLYLSRNLPEKLDWEIVIVINFDLITKSIKDKVM
jgi:hypothetical protein